MTFTVSKKIPMLRFWTWQQPNRRPNTHRYIDSDFFYDNQKGKKNHHIKQNKNLESKPVTNHKMNKSIKINKLKKLERRGGHVSTGKWPNPMKINTIHVQLYLCVTCMHHMLANTHTHCTHMHMHAHTHRHTHTHIGTGIKLCG